MGRNEARPPRPPRERTWSGLRARMAVGAHPEPGTAVDAVLSGSPGPLIPCTIAGPEAPRQQATRGGRAGWEASRGSDSEESSCCGQQGRGGRPPLPLTQSNRPIQTQTARPPRRSAVSDDEGGSAGLNSFIQAPPNHDPADSSTPFRGADGCPGPSASTALQNSQSRPCDDLRRRGGRDPDRPTAETTRSRRDCALAVAERGHRILTSPERADASDRRSPRRSSA